MRLRAAEIAERLAAMPEQVASMLLPAGKRDGSYWTAGDVSGSDGKSLRVYLTGPKAGRWRDYASDEHGDLLDLWAATRRQDMAEAMRDAAEWLGVRVTEFREPSRQYNRPQKRIEPLSDAHRQWLNGRGLTDEVIDRLRIGSQGDAVAFPSYIGDELAAVKYRTLDKRMWSEKDCEPVLFGWQAIPERARSVAIVEGECFPGDAQILTEDGWVRFSNYRSGKVAQWSDGEIEFVHPVARVQKQFSGQLVRYQSKGFVSETTPNHKLISLDGQGRPYAHTAIEGPNAKGHKIPRCGIADGCGIPLSDAQIRLCIAISADAAIDQRKNALAANSQRPVAAEQRYARFGFKKQRKIDRLRSVLTECSLHASDSSLKNGYQSICLSIPDWVPGRLFPWKWVSLATSRQRELILSELAHWDGNAVPNRNQTEYSSKHLENAEWVQAMAHLSGRVSTVIPRQNEIGEWFKVSILHGKMDTSWQPLKGAQKRVAYRGKVYCVQVPAGAIMVRQEGVVTVSGNCDAAAMQVYGMPTLSVPNGGGAKQAVWIEREYDRLNRFDRIYLAMDQDEPGQVAAKEIMDRLGAERCLLVELPMKDANECLKAGVRKEAMRAFFRHATAIDPDELKRPSDYSRELHEQFFGRSDDETGLTLPFPSLSDSLRLRQGEVVLLAGENGSGKSQMAGHITLEALRGDVRACVASMEFKAPRYLKRMVRQAGAQHDPSEAYLDAIISAWDDRLWVFSVRGTAKRDRMLEVFRYARQRYGIRFFVIDNLAKCGIAEDDYNGQKEFVDQLTDFASETESTVLLVHHMRKGGQGKEGVKGSGGITDMVDTVLIIWRNRAKEDKLRTLQAEDEPDEEAIKELQLKPDGAISCVKQRNYEGTGDGEPRKVFWFDRSSYQFLSGPSSRPFRYVDWSAIEQRGAA